MTDCCEFTLCPLNCCTAGKLSVDNEHNNYPIESLKIENCPWRTEDGVTKATIQFETDGFVDCITLTGLNLSCDGYYRVSGSETIEGLDEPFTSTRNLISENTSYNASLVEFGDYTPSPYMMTLKTVVNGNQCTFLPYVQYYNSGIQSATCNENCCGCPDNDVVINVKIPNKNNSLKYWRIEIVDDNNTDGYITAKSLYTGACFVTDCTIDDDFTITPVDDSEVTRTACGGRKTGCGNIHNEISVKYSLMDECEAFELLSYFQKFGKRSKFYISICSMCNGTYPNHYIASPKTLNPLKRRSTGIYSQSLIFEEI